MKSWENLKPSIMVSLIGSMKTRCKFPIMLRLLLENPSKTPLKMLK